MTTHLRLTHLRWLGFTLLASLGLGTASLPGAEAALEPMDLARALDRAFVEVAEKASRFVVVIEASRKAEPADAFNQAHPFWDMLPKEFRDQFEQQWKEEGSPRQRPQPRVNGQGSGVVIRKDGYILTNRHVVEGADRIKVRFRDGREFDATLRGEDAQSDVAVLKVEAEDLEAAVVADSSKVRVGQFAIAIGTPYELDYSVTFGHVSAMGRSSLIMDLTMDQNFIQTDANINPGNSGGPLVNIDGEVIGINTLIRGLHTGIGFAIPSNMAMEVAERLIQDGRYVRSWLGIGILALRNHPDYRDLVKDIRDGIVVTSIRKEGPAFDSELRANDIITKVNGTPVATEPDLKASIRSKPVGEEVVLDVHRLDAEFHGQNIQVKVKLAAWPEELPTLAMAPRLPRNENARKLGLTVELLTRELAEAHGIDSLDGVIVTEVAQDSPADQKGIGPGDVITQVNQKPVKTPKEFHDALKDADLEKGVIVNFASKGMNQFVILKVVQE